MDAVDNATPMVGVTPALDDNLVNFDTEAAKVEEAPAEAVIMRSLEPPLRDCPFTISYPWLPFKDETVVGDCHQEHQEEDGGQTRCPP